MSDPIQIERDADDEEAFRIFKPADAKTKRTTAPPVPASASTRQLFTPITSTRLASVPLHAVRVPPGDRAPAFLIDSTSTVASAPTLGESEAALSADMESALCEVLGRSPEPGETIEIAFTRKEHAAAGLFERLTVSEARVLLQRLSDPDEADALAKLFLRLAIPRRTRLLAYLGDARRRAAIQRSR